MSVPVRIGFRPTRQMLEVERRFGGVLTIDELLRRQIEKHRGRIADVAAEMQVARPTIYVWIKQLDIPVEIGLDPRRRTLAVVS